MAPIPRQPETNDEKSICELEDQPNLIIASSDEEDVPEERYILLAQEEHNMDNGESENSSLTEIMNSLNTYGVNVISPENDASGYSEETFPADLPEKETPSASNGSEEQLKVWENSSSKEIPLDETKQNEIKNVMSGFTLPKSAVPKWATNISDDELTAHISSLMKK